MKKGHTINALDHGYVKLVDWMGNDEAVIEAARMSTGRGFEGWDKDAKLLTYLYSHRHMTPFECGGELMIEVQAPIMVFREWMRHRTFSFNEFSARYSQMPDLHYVPRLSRIQVQSKTNRQGSDEAFPEPYAETILRDFRYEQEMLYQHYDRLLSEGMSREVARLNTPISRYSKMRAKTDLRNWLSFLLLRMAPNAQWEIRQYANAVAEIVRALWPRTFELFEEYDLYGVHLSRSEALAAGIIDISDGANPVDLINRPARTIDKLQSAAGERRVGSTDLIREP